MTILFNLCSLGAAIISFLAGFRFRKNYQKRKIEQLRDFSNAWFCVSLGFTFLFFPNLVLFNPFWVQIIFILADLSYLGAILFFIPTVASFFREPPLLKKISFLLLFSWILIYAFLSILFFSPAISLERDGVVYYWKSGMPLLQGIARAIFCFGAFFMGIFFIFQAKKIKEKILSRRSFLVGLGALLVTIAGIILFFFPYFYFSEKVLILSGLIGLCGFSLGIISINFFQPQEKND